jgi:hypothetical protein
MAISEARPLRAGSLLEQFHLAPGEPLLKPGERALREQELLGLAVAGESGPDIRSVGVEQDGLHGE